MKLHISLPILAVVFIAVQSMTAHADFYDMMNTPLPSSSSMFSSTSSLFPPVSSSFSSSFSSVAGSPDYCSADFAGEEILDENADLTMCANVALASTCNCTWIREVTVDAQSEQEARMKALATPPMKPEDVVSSCVKQGETTMYQCTITRMTSKSSGQKQCIAYENGMKKQYVPNPYKSIMCIFNPMAS